MKLAILATLAALHSCHAVPPPMPLQESCKVLDETLFKDGHLMFTPVEIAALSQDNKVKLVAVKKYYRANCQ